MSMTVPWHSIGEAVHHTNMGCKAGPFIKPDQYRLGTGDKPHCKECARLDAAGMKIAKSR